jgi:hypothetical protein
VPLTSPNAVRHLVTHDRPVLFFHVSPGTAPRSSPVLPRTFCRKLPHFPSEDRYMGSLLLSHQEKSHNTACLFPASIAVLVRFFGLSFIFHLRCPGYAPKHQPISNARSLELSIALGYLPRTFERPSVTLWVMICGSRPPGPSAFCEFHYLVEGVSLFVDNQPFGRLPHSSRRVHF